MNETYKTLLKNLISDFSKLQFDKWNEWLLKASIKDCQVWFSRCLNLIENITTENSYYYRETERIIKGSKRTGGIYANECNMLKGHLEALWQDIEDGLLAKIEYKITAQDFLDFFDHAKIYLKDKKKIEASVIASAIFEDTIRKVGKKNDIDYKKLDRLIDELKKAEIILATEAKKFKYYAGIRNEALHANWDSFELSDIKELINGTEDTIGKYLES